ncbi:hypothetical protein FIBSPDRAFT_899953 [Athelia psychrophila]|uniref:Uncharacterized protein n=1 Tax=Athelia psychrophila TaxID=1759441 RepID=A0A165Z2Z9_9AGAM|nr:hypothetical protein FIBSPDRAFT_899953 [Fibularhizoctonia sp. CBS 109695]
MEGSDTEIDHYQTALRNILGSDRLLSLPLATDHNNELTELARPAIDYARRLFLPFAAATPHVQFPPGHEHSYHIFSNADIPEPVADAKHGYRYTALIAFSDGRLEKVPVSYTTFHRVRRSAPVNQTLFTNVTVSGDGCRGDTHELGACPPLCSHNDDVEMRTARIDLENGGVVDA